MRRLILPLAQAGSALALSFCQKECEPVTSLLSTCKLPELRSDFHFPSGPPKPEVRNVTGQSGYYGLAPSTYFVETLGNAQCFCTDARLHLGDCKACLNDHWRSSDGDIHGVPINGEWNATSAYERDCHEFGYFANQTFGYPTSTRSAPPSATRSPHVDVAAGYDSQTVRSCRDMLAVVEGQIDECQLTPLDAKHKPNDQSIEVGDASVPVTHAEASFLVSVVADRGASECVCTLPVMRRWQAISQCLRGVASEINDAYQTDCSKWGFWPDDKPVQFENDPAQTTTTHQAATLSPTPTSSSGAVLRVECLLLTLAISSLVVFIY